MQMLSVGYMLTVHMHSVRVDLLRVRVYRLSEQMLGVSVHMLSVHVCLGELEGIESSQRLPLCVS